MRRDGIGSTLTRILVVSSALASDVGCAKIIGADFDGARLEPARHDASADSAPHEAAATCHPLVPPERPVLATATDEIEFSVVVSHVDFGDHAPDGGAPAYLTTGYDLDGLCTGPKGPSACVAQPWIGGVHADGPRGQDDAVASLMLNQITNFGVSAVGSTTVNAGVASGHDAPIGVIRVKNFGGLGEDDHVDVEWFAAAALHTAGDGGRPEGGVAPRFDATDHWPIISTSVIDPGVANVENAVSVYRDAQAFVTKNTLVASFPRIQIPLSNVYFEVLGVKLTGGLRRVDGFWRIENVVLAGYASTNALLGVIPQIGYVVFGVAFCTDNKANYPKVKRFLCESADLPPAIGDPPTSRCASTSAGINIETMPASLGPIVPAPTASSPCPPATDPRNDSCDIPPVTD